MTGKRSKTSALFYLVKSLNPEDKATIFAYSSVYGSRNGAPSKMWQVLDFLYNEPVWDKDRFRERFRSGNIAALKYNTRKWIKKILNRIGSVFHSELKDIIGEIDISIQRKDLGDAFELIREGKKLARKYQLFPYLLRVLQQELKILPQFIVGGELKRLMEANDEEFGFAIKELENSRKYHNLYIDFYVPAKKFWREKGESPLRMLEQAVSDPLLQVDPDTLDWRSQLIFHNICAYRYFFKGDRKGLQKHCEKSLRVFEQNPWLVGEWKDDFFETALLLIFIYQLNHEREKADQLLDLFEEHMRESTIKQYSGIGTMILAKFGHGEAFGTTVASKEAYEASKRELSYLQFALPKQQLVQIFYMAFRYTIKSEKSEDTYFWIDLILRENSSINYSIHVYSRIQYLLCLVEEYLNGDQMNYHLVKSFGGSIARFIGKKKSRFSTLHDLAKVLTNLPDKIEKKRKLQNSLETFVSGIFDEQQKGDLDRVGWSDWVERNRKKLNL